MEITRIVHMRVMKGLGPDWIDKVIEINYDDVETGTPESEITAMVTADAKRQMERAGYLRSYVKEIENA
jgi:hypothetical protein